TTLLTFRKFPVEYSLNIVTNSIAIALEASSNPNYNVILIGGSVNTKYQFSFGADAVEQLGNYYADKLILSVDGIDIESGFSTYYDKEADIDRIMIERSRTRIIAADNSKFRHSAFVKISDVSVADFIVTNSRTDKTYLKELKDQGIEIVI
ncbi:MAG: DeoR/GlpR transcriptional regulator, partial [Clostridia bacterium]|nr:DeoR/GlpR transcriptional regulator [Clostridia bacterium]